MSSIPMMVQTGNLEHKNTIQSLADLQRHIHDGDLDKLTRAVFLQAFGGFGIDAMRLCVVECLRSRSIFDPVNCCKVIACYLRWSGGRFSMESSEDQRQFLIDLYNMCEIMVVCTEAPNYFVSAVAYVDQRTDVPCFDSAKSLMESKDPFRLNGFYKTVIRWVNLDDKKNLYELVAHICNNYPDNNEAQTFIELSQDANMDKQSRIYALLAALHVCFPEFGYPMLQPSIHVTEHVDLPKIWCELFPKDLALPIFN